MHFRSPHGTPSQGFRFPARLRLAAQPHRPPKSRQRSIASQRVAVGRHQTAKARRTATRTIFRRRSISSLPPRLSARRVFRITERRRSPTRGIGRQTPETRHSGHSAASWIPALPVDPLSRDRCRRMRIGSYRLARVEVQRESHREEPCGHPTPCQPLRQDRLTLTRHV